jgi:hypothetical protein
VELVKEKTVSRLVGAWFTLALVGGLAMTGVMIWGLIEIVQWIGRH